MSDTATNTDKLQWHDHPTQWSRSILAIAAVSIPPFSCHQAVLSGPQLFNIHHMKCKLWHCNLVFTFFSILHRKWCHRKILYFTTCTRLPTVATKDVKTIYLHSLLQQKPCNGPTTQPQRTTEVSEISAYYDWQLYTLRQHVHTASLWLYTNDL